MTEERRKLFLSVLVYIMIIALVAFVLFHQTIVKQTRAAAGYDVRSWWKLT